MRRPEENRGYEPTQNEPAKMKLPRGASPTVQKRILAEAELQPANERHPAAIYRLIRDEMGDYSVEYIVGLRTMSNVKHTFSEALRVFMDAVVDAEVERRD
jgi:hypothetical protein